MNRIIGSVPESHAELSTEFSTADTVGPISISFSGDRLAVTFARFRTPVQTVLFKNVRAFSWNEWEDAPTDARPDSILEIKGSDFLAPWTSFSVEGAPFRHYKLGFNAEGKFLDVVATHMEHRSSVPHE